MPSMTFAHAGHSMLALAAALALAGCAGLAPRDAGITIKRDGYGVPHVYANDERGLFHGFGYAVAQDRLYQLEMVRRSGNGSVAEVLGAAYVAADTATRSNLDPASIRRQIDALSAQDRAMFEGYAAGINARIREVLADRARLLPREFTAHGFDPTPWAADDAAMVWIGLILNRFFGTSTEVANLMLRNQLVAARGERIGQQIFDQLRWLEDPTAPTIIPRPAAVSAAHTPRADFTAPALRPISTAAAQAHRERRLALSGGAGDEMPSASNAWVLAPSRTVDGRAVLHNGPQQGFNNPAFVHGIGLHGAGWDVTGATPIGLLPVLFGTNGTIAWGSTVGSLDTNDVYQERLNPDNRHEYFHDGAYRPMSKRTDVIKVKGEADRSVDIWSTVHGFVDSWDTAQHTAYTIRRSWQGREVETLLGWAKAAQARDWEQFMAQGARVGASITWFYADVAGNIGAAGLGSLPKRPSTQDIRLPAIGDGTMEWQGLLPFSTNPKSYNPAQGYLVSWNNQIAAGLRADGANFSHVDRVNEIAQPLAGTQKLSAEQIWRVGQPGAMADLNARYFVPLIVQAAAALPATDAARGAADLLGAWDRRSVDADGDGFYDGAGTTILRAWLGTMTRLLLQDDLPSEVFQGLTALGYAPATGAVSPGSVQPARAAKLIWNALRGAQSGVPQHYDFLNGKDGATVVRAALVEAVAQLGSQHGPDMAKWRTPVAPHRFAPLNAIGVPWADGAQQSPVYMNRGTTDYQVVLQPGAVTMCSVLAPGQSGFVAPDGTRSPHYADQLALFGSYGCHSQRIGAEAVDADTRSTQRLGY